METKKNKTIKANPRDITNLKNIQRNRVFQELSEKIGVPVETSTTSTDVNIYIIHGNLNMKEDMFFDGSLIVEGDIIGNSNLYYDLKVGGSISAKEINVQKLFTGDIHAWNIVASNIIAGRIFAWKISSEDIHARDISAREISIRNIFTQNLSAWKVKAENIFAETISVTNVYAKNIDVWNISAKNVNASLIICEKLKQEEGSTLMIQKLQENRSNFGQREIKRNGVSYPNFNLLKG
jgi:hypothetical protein